MGISKPKEQMTREEIEEIIEYNTRLFRNDPHFPKYIVHLTAYLMEYHYHEFIKHRSSGYTTGVGKLRYKVVSSAAMGDSWEMDNDEDFCSGCGAPLNGRIKCDRCGTVKTN
ncbi:hypothetical protein JXA32_16265 [Candidatus Sumerlaeota bacterium]|nr:hypothetical protein [Candidatus Sumerlaeota bacterium]